MDQAGGVGAPPAPGPAPAIATPPQKGPTPYKTTLCALSLVYCHQSAQLSLRQAQSAAQSHMMMDEDNFDDAQGAAEVAERTETVMAGLPAGQRNALALGSLSAETQDVLCDFILKSIVSLGARSGSALAEKTKTRTHQARDEDVPSVGDLQLRLYQVLQVDGEECAEDARELNAGLGFFLQTMETPDDLNMFFQQVHKLVWRDRAPQEARKVASNPVVEPNSLLGVFLRECCVAFELLSFEGVGRLLRRVTAFQGEAMEVASASPLTTATASASSARKRREKGAKVDPAEVLETFLADVASKDYYSALRSLHTFFDYSAGRHQGLAQVDTRLGNFEHATLELAQLHVDFGHIWEGIKALEETLRSSQQNTNHICLVHSLTLMCQILAMPEYCFNQSKLATRIMRADAGFLYILDHSSKKHLRLLLYHCLQRARALKLPHIEAFACIEMMKQKLASCPNSASANAEMDQIGRLLDEILYAVNNDSAEADCGAAALEDLGLEFTTKVSLYNHDVLTRREMLRAGPGSVRGLVEDLVTTLHLLQVTRWETRGCREYAMALAERLLERPKGRKNPTAIALVTTYALLEKGLSAAAETLNRHTKARDEREGLVVLKTKEVRKAELALEYHRLLFGGNHVGAAKAAAQMEVLCGARQTSDVFLFVESQSLMVGALVAGGDHFGARRVAEKAFRVAFESGLKKECLQCLLILAKVCLATGDAQGALPHVLSAYHQSRAMAMEVVFHESVFLLGETYRAQGGPMVPRALALVRKHLPAILAKCSLETRGRAHLLLARCLMEVAAAGKAETGETGAVVLDHLTRAGEAFGTLGHQGLRMEAAYVTAHAAHALGMTKERDEAARDFKALQGTIQTASA